LFKRGDHRPIDEDAFGTAARAFAKGTLRRDADFGSDQRTKSGTNQLAWLSGL